MLGKDYEGQDCALARALEVVGERWTLLIVRDAFFGVRRYNDFQAHLDIPKGVLSDRLSGLIEDGILDRRPDPHHAGRHLYQLTPAGTDLWPAISALLAWGSRHRHPSRLIFKHATCDTELDDQGRCPTCDATPDPDQIVTEPRPGRANSRSDPVAVALRTRHRLLQPIDAA